MFGLMVDANRKDSQRKEYFQGYVAMVTSYLKRTIPPALSHHDLQSPEVRNASLYCALQCAIFSYPPTFFCMFDFKIHAKKAEIQNKAEMQKRAEFNLKNNAKKANMYI